MHQNQLVFLCIPTCRFFVVIKPYRHHVLMFKWFGQSDILDTVLSAHSNRPRAIFTQTACQENKLNIFSQLKI